VPAAFRGTRVLERVAMPTEINMLSGGAMRRFLAEAVPLYESASGNKVSIRFAVTREMKAAIEAGAAFDVALLPRRAIDELATSGKIAGDDRTDIARSVVGLLVRTGAPAPRMGSVDAFKALLRAAKSISYSKGPSGEYVGELLQRLGLADEMKGKTVFAIGRPVGEVIASGEAEIGMQQIIENQPVKGAHLVGPLPRELGNYVLYSAGFPAGGQGNGEVRAFVAFLRSPEAVRIICEKGMEPG
jgi:molybdate transport system substrate-binding protein